MALTKIQLDKMAAHGCANPDCDHKNHEGEIYLNSRCHPGAPVHAVYKLRSGKVRLMCCVCKKFVADVAVANS